jgi:serine/threonine-protein kinase
MFSGAWLSSERLVLDGMHRSYLVSSSGGDLAPLDDAYSWPQMLPGGEHMLYVRRQAGTRQHRAGVVRIRDFSPAADLLEVDSRVMYVASTVAPDQGYLLYVSAGNLLARPFDPRTLRMSGEAAAVASKVYFFGPSGAADFSVSESGTLAYLNYVSRSQLVWVDRTGRQLGTIGPSNINVQYARLSPDGQRLATAIYDIEQGQQDLWIFDVKTNSGRRLSSDAALRDSPVWSPDSTKLAFGKNPGGNLPKVYLRSLGESDREEAMPGADFQMPADWSPDGRFVLYNNTGLPRVANETQGDVLVFDLVRRGKPLPLLNTRFHEANAAFSPDGKWLAFTSSESGRPELYLQAFQSGETPAVTGERYLISRTGASAVRWRRDGRELFYLDSDGRVQAVPVRLSPKPQFGDAAPLFTISTEARAAIHSTVGFDVSADGSRFVIPVVASSEKPALVLIHNWEAILTTKR